MQGISPHVAACQWLIMREDNRIVLGVGLVAALSDPAGMVCERVVEAPTTSEGHGSRLVDKLSQQWDSSAVSQQ